MSVKNIHCFISGRVQGVYFRASTRDKATELGINGWVRNLDDGRVEVMASAEATQIDALIQWLHHGPALAKVDKVEFDNDTNPQTQTFSIK